jgi:hypothetical protein
MPGKTDSTLKPNRHRTTNLISASRGKDSLTRIRDRPAGTARTTGHQNGQNGPIGLARVAIALGNLPTLDTKFTPHLHRRAQFRPAELAEVPLDFRSFSSLS